MWGRRLVLNEALDPRSNALNFVRLSLASLVIFYHSFPLGGFGKGPFVGAVPLGGLAVAGFFAISGYLITQSRTRLPLSTYLVRRLGRIFPGYWGCLVVTAFLIAPVASLSTGGWTTIGAWNYVAASADMVKWIGGIGSTQDGLPYPATWNGSFWTLRHELACYILVGVGLCIRPVRDRREVAVAALLILTLAAGLTPATAPQTVNDFLFVGPYFAAGAVCFYYAESIRIDGRLAVVAALVAALAVQSSSTIAISAMPLCYLVLWLGVCLPNVTRSIGAKNDISYGVYLYGFPVQQMLAAFSVQDLGVGAYASASLIATLPFAWASWWVVERPAMKWSKRYGVRPQQQRVR